MQLGRQERRRPTDCQDGVKKLERMERRAKAGRERVRLEGRTQELWWRTEKR